MSELKSMDENASDFKYGDMVKFIGVVDGQTFKVLMVDGPVVHIEDKEGRSGSAFKMTMELVDNSSKLKGE